MISSASARVIPLAIPILIFVYEVLSIFGSGF